MCDHWPVTAEAAGGGRRERRKARARQRLMDATRELIAESGVAGLRISDITERADLGFGTFYTYFETKDAVVEAVVAETLAELVRSIGTAAVTSEDPAEAAASSFRRFLRFAHEQPDLTRVLVELDRTEPIFETSVRPWARQAIERGCAAGQFTIADTELALVTVASSALGVIRAMLAGVVAAGPETESRGAEMMLRAFGVDAEAAHRIAHIELTTDESVSAPTR